MKIRYFILIIILFVLSSIQTIAQNEIQNNDSVRTMFLSIRLAEGISEFYIFRLGHYGDSDRNTYEFRDIDGYSSQLGVKLTSTTKENTAFTIELNYLASQLYLKYHGCDCGHMGGTFYNSDYKITLHSFQLAILPKTSLGKKQFFYTSFGPYVNVPFYADKKGKMTISNSGYTYNSEEYYDNDIKTPLQAELGGVLNIGTNYKLKKNMLSVELRFQSNLFGDIKGFYVHTNTIALSAIYTFTDKPLHITFWTN